MVNVRSMVEVLEFTPRETARKTPDILFFFDKCCRDTEFGKAQGGRKAAHTCTEYVYFLLALFHYHTVNPPSTAIFCPVMYRASSDARNAIAPVRSRGSAMRPSGVFFVYRSRKYGS